MKLLIRTAGGILALAFYATACSQPTSQPVNSVAPKSEVLNATPTPIIRKLDIEDLPEGWTREEILERGDLTQLTARAPCLTSKKGFKSRVINVSVYVYVERLTGVIVAAHALPDDQADTEELKEAETEAKLSMVLIPIYLAPDKPQKWRGKIEVKVRHVCV